MKKFLILLIIILSACSSQEDIAEDSSPAILRIMTHDSFAIPEEIITAFENENNVTIQILKSGDTGSTVNKAVLSVNNPLADVMYGIDNTFLSRGISGGIFEPYQSIELKNISDEFLIDAEFNVTPVDYGDVCINYQTSYFEENELPLPETLTDLTKPEYKGLLVVENPAISSPGLAFLFTTIGHFGESGYLDFWDDLIKNDVLIVNDWETAYYQEFSQWGGTRPMVVSYSSSPTFEYLFSEEEIDSPPTAAITATDTCFRQIEFVGILKGTENLALAQKWVDYMLSVPFQEEIPLNMYVFPVNNNAKLDEAFVDFLITPANPISLSYSAIEENRENWIGDWRLATDK